MARRCTVCRHPQKAEIEEAMVTGEPERTIADRYGLSKSGVHRHATNHLPTILAHAARRRNQQQEAELIDFAIADWRSRLSVQNTRWLVLNRRVLQLLDDSGATSACLSLLRELRELEKQTAKELGQYGEANAHSAAVPAVVVISPDVRKPSESGFEDTRLIDDCDAVDAKSPAPDDDHF